MCRSAGTQPSGHTSVSRVGTGLNRMVQKRKGATCYLWGAWARCKGCLAFGEPLHAPGAEQAPPGIKDKPGQNFRLVWQIRRNFIIIIFSKLAQGSEEGEITAFFKIQWGKICFLMTRFLQPESQITLEIKNASLPCLQGVTIPKMVSSCLNFTQNPGSFIQLPTQPSPLSALYHHPPPRAGDNMAQHPPGSCPDSPL